MLHRTSQIARPCAIALFVTTAACGSSPLAGSGIVAPDAASTTDAGVLFGASTPPPSPRELPDASGGPAALPGREEPPTRVARDDERAGTPAPPRDPVDYTDVRVLGTDAGTWSTIDDVDLRGASDPGSTPPDEELDSDGDGLSDAEEEREGTDPQERDTDGDGALDGSEPYAGTDPRVADRACAESHFEALLSNRPIDVLLVVDNSGSMRSEIQAVEANINVNFASILDASGLDYRVVVISQHGSSFHGQRICVSAPLSATDCRPTPTHPAETERFRHHSTRVGSHNALGRILRTWDSADFLGRAPDGWRGWVRPDSVKFIVVITDDEASMSADRFDQELLALDPASFGTAEERRYVLHSIVGVAPNDGESAAWPPDAPLVDQKCQPDAVNAGRTYQTLSRLTGGIRYPICQNQSFDVVFRDIAQGAVEEVRLRCSIDAPVAPDGQLADLERTIIEYRPGAGGPIRQVLPVAGPDACAGDAFYAADGQVHLCAPLCDEVLGDTSGDLWVRSRCQQACEEPAPELCEDRVDNDCDGMTDLDDEDCFHLDGEAR